MCVLVVADTIVVVVDFVVVVVVAVAVVVALVNVDVVLCLLFGIFLFCSLLLLLCYFCGSVHPVGCRV